MVVSCESPFHVRGKTCLAGSVETITIRFDRALVKSSRHSLSLIHRRLALLAGRNILAADEISFIREGTLVFLNCNLISNCSAEYDRDARVTYLPLGRLSRLRRGRRAAGKSSWLMAL